MAKSPAWTRREGKNKEGGLNRKGIESYRKEHPGSKLSMAVTEKDPGPKREARRKSFCARSAGQKEMHGVDCSKTPEKRICLARKKWRCK